MHFQQWFYCSWPLPATILWCPAWAVLAAGVCTEHHVGQRLPGVKMGQCPWLSWAAVTLTFTLSCPENVLTDGDLGTQVRSEGILSCGPPPPHSLSLSSGLTRQLHYALGLGRGGGVDVPNFYFLNIHLKPLFVKKKKSCWIQHSQKRTLDQEDSTTRLHLNTSQLIQELENRFLQSC